MNVEKGVQINYVKYINKDIVDQWLHYQRADYTDQKHQKEECEHINQKL